MSFKTSHIDGMDGCLEIWLCPVPDFKLVDCNDSANDNFLTGVLCNPFIGGGGGGGAGIPVSIDGGGGGGGGGGWHEVEKGGGGGIGVAGILP